ncbi:right-handed parallel beta-helix repeat-containing protein [Candidatus Woesearchaeota archaeon]|nr:right-handed parallel beta-helix repeat-containing protein [Candidatus Woesearchaeota archaeon]
MQKPLYLLFVIIVIVVTSLNTLAQSNSWLPPIGIPMPIFGINEVAPPAPNPWDNPVPGFYYVCETCAGVTDTSNPYGTPSKPRKTIPGTESNPLPAGSVVEVHGKYTTSHSSPRDWHGRGTALQPIFVRGADSTQKPLITASFAVIGSSYAIFENLEFGDQDGDLTGGTTGKFGVTDKNGKRYDSDHIVLRNSDAHGNLGSGGGGIAVGGKYSEISYIVFYKNEIHDNGNWQATFDQDVHGIAVGRANNIWVLNNKLYRNSGDGIQINGLTATTHHIYVGRNTAWQNKQMGFWTKTASDVIFSENIAYGHRPSGSSTGSGMGYQYDPVRVWFIFNEGYDNTNGINSGSTNVGGRADIYIIGNLFRDNLNSGIQINDGSEIVNIIGNTLYNNPKGIENGYYTSKSLISNNIIVASDKHIAFSSAYLTGKNSDTRNNLFSAPAKILWDGTMRDVASMQSIGECLGCKEGNPDFVNPTLNNFNLLSSSIAIDAGLVEASYANFKQLYNIDINVDRENKLRPKGLAWDIGAYEYSEVMPPPTDTTPPIITNTIASLITSSSATITWQTNEMSTHQVEYGTTISYGFTTAENTNLMTSHSETLTGLKQNTLYHYIVKSKDASGNLATSEDFTFMTSPSKPNVQLSCKKYCSQQCR